MTIKTEHPEYQEIKDLWIQMDETYKGEASVKAQGVKYLSATASMVFDGLGLNQAGAAAYKSYLLRAVFHNYVQEAVTNMVGIMHREPAVFELPGRMKELEENATADGESLQQLLRRINERQLLDGRLGLLADVTQGSSIKELPFLVFYRAERIINWDVGARERGKRELNFVVLDESEDVRDTFTWSLALKYRVLFKGLDHTVIDGKTLTSDDALAKGNLFSLAVVEDDQVPSISADDLVTPSFSSKQLDFIPFTFINAVDLIPAVGLIPLLSLSDLSLAVYRGEADYRQTLFNQSQETLVVVGATDDDGTEEGDKDKVTRVGSGARIDLPEGGSASYVGVNGVGLTEQRMALENDKEEAQLQGAKLLNTESGSQESGEALRIRVAATTANLSAIARTGATGLEDALKQIAIWMEEDPNKVKVKANTDFTEDDFLGQDFLAIMQAVEFGFPLSERSLHKVAQQKDLTDMSFEEEMPLVRAEREARVRSTLGIGEDEESQE